jgi:predicted nucleic acid-binding protein
MPLRVVLDTNVLVSAAGYPGGTPARILDAWESGEFRLILSNYILGELVRVLPRLPKHRIN